MKARALRLEVQLHAIEPQRREWKHNFKNGAAGYTLQPYSINVLRFE